MGSSTSNRRRSVGISLVAASVLPVARALAVDYQIVRVANGLNQPNYVTQAPGDPSNILFYSERAAPPTGGVTNYEGFNTVNRMGRVMRYDVTTHTQTTVIDLSSRKIWNDDGLEGVAFSPDFNNVGTPGFGKIYVSSSEYTGSQAFGTLGTAGSHPVPVDRVEEYTTTNPANPSTANTTLTRTIIQYNNNVQNNHTIDSIGFDPTATGEARYNLYISTGNASFGNPYGSAISPGGMPSQNPSDVRGKILRVDVNSTLADAYPGDATKNFAIPSNNPIPTYNAAHPGAPIMGVVNNGSGGAVAAAALGEVYVTGMRNAYRVTFDRGTGDMYLGDVGENAVEEVDFLKAGTNTGATTGPVDFGWPDKEGTSNTTTVSGAPHTGTNPFTGATALNPIQQFTHTGGNAVIGGYVYRGPIASLQGKYFYTDFVTGSVRMLDFDPNTSPGSFNGANGTVTPVSPAWNTDSTLFDPTDPTYNSTNVSQPFGTAAWGLDHTVSFGEDNAGNMLVVDFGGTAGDTSFTSQTGEYPGAGRGEIFMLVPGPINVVWNNTGAGSPNDGATWDGNNNFNWHYTTGPTYFRDGENVTFDQTSITLAHNNIAVSGTVKPGSITVNNTTGTYTFGGGGIIADSAAGPTTLTKSNAGTLVLNNINTFTGATAVNGGTLTIGLSGSLASASISIASGATMNVNGSLAATSAITANGSLNFAGNTTTSAPVLRTIGALSIGASATATILASVSNAVASVLKASSVTFADTTSHLDVKNNELLVGGTSLAGVRAALANATLMTSSSGGALGYIDRSGDLGPGFVEVRFTLGGDSNLDGAVNVGDLGTLATNYGATANDVWTQGDFDYNGAVDVADLGTLATNYGNSIPGYTAGGLGDSLAGATAAIANASSVPEPAMCTLLFAPALMLLQRRRRNHAR